MSDCDSRSYLGFHEVFVALDTTRLCTVVYLVMVWPGEQYKNYYNYVVLFRHNLPEATEAQLMRGEFRETLLRIVQGVMLSCRFAE